MRHLVVGLALLGFSACTADQQAEVRSIERTTCVIDRAGQIAIVPIEELAAALEPLASIPIAVGHRAAQLGCAVVLAPKPGG